MTRNQTTALLGLLAIAGYQNRDKIARLLKSWGQGAQSTGQRPQAAQTSGPQAGWQEQDVGQQTSGQQTSGFDFGGLADLFKGGSITGALGELLEQFQQTGHGAQAQSWVKEGLNASISEQELEETLGPDVLGDLISRTGLSRQDLLNRLSRELPRAVDELTPEGRLPTTDDEPTTARQPDG